MAKRRRGFDRRPATVRPAPAPGSARRRPIGAVLFVGAGLVVAILIVSLGSTLGRDEASPSAAAIRSPSPPPSLVGTIAPTPTTGGSAPVISGIACDVDEKTTYHVHAHLNIRIDGQLDLPPAGVGITPTCLYWLHTHQGQGVIHIEAPVETTFTLGQFFDVWGRPLSSTRVLDASVGGGRSLFMFVDGQPYDGDPRAIELRNLESIELQVGTELLEPLPYTFPADLQ